MPPKRRPPAFPSWPDHRTLAWAERARLTASFERERLLALWMHGTATRRWRIEALQTVSRVGDGWIWYGIIVCLPWAGGAVGTSASVHMLALGTVDLVI